MELLAGTVTVDDVDAFVERLGTVADDHGVTVQAFDARYVVDREHLRRAVDLADRAIDRGENVADDRAVEILLYAAGRRQIDRAFEMGVSEGAVPVVVLVDDPDERGAETRAAIAEDDATNEDDAEALAAAALQSSLGLALESTDEAASRVGEYDPERVRDFFDVGAAELAAVDGDLADVVRERVALLDVEK